jgi:acetylornithine deacetylase/succinyl-diaminopimelate desuccinylase-like protein
VVYRRRNLIPLFTIAILSILVSPSIAQFADVAPCPVDLQVGFESITTEKIQSLVSVLAGPHFQGRGTGQKGYKKAAHWVAGKLAEFGVEPIYADGGYFQPVPLQQKVPILQECYLRAGDVTIPAQGNIGFDTYSSQPSVLGNLIFVRCPTGRFKIPPSAILRDAIHRSVALANPVRVTKIEVPNVIGVIPGSDPDLRHEHIIIGAHLDHIGITSGGIFRGADDNGSGCSAVLSIAEALTTNKTRPKRSVVFMFFAAEESGLVGSNYYCQQTKTRAASILSVPARAATHFTTLSPLPTDTSVFVSS